MNEDKTVWKQNEVPAIEVVDTKRATQLRGIDASLRRAYEADRELKREMTR